MHRQLLLQNSIEGLKFILSKRHFLNPSFSSIFSESIFFRRSSISMKKTLKKERLLHKYIAFLETSVKVQFIFVICRAGQRFSARQIANANPTGPERPISTV